MNNIEKYEDEEQDKYVDQLVYLNWVRIYDPPRDVWLDLYGDGKEHPNNHKECSGYHLYNVGNVVTGDGCIVPVFVETLSECQTLSALVYQHRRSNGRRWSSIKSFHRLMNRMIKSA